MVLTKSVVNSTANSHVRRITNNCGLQKVCKQNERIVIIVTSAVNGWKLSLVYCLSAIMRISGFRTGSEETVLVLIKTIPIDMRRMYLPRLECPGQTAAIKAGERWQNSLKGKRTFHSTLLLI